jgi:hypothetical protein
MLDPVILKRFETPDEVRFVSCALLARETSRWVEQDDRWIPWRD